MNNYASNMYKNEWIWKHSRHVFSLYELKFRIWFSHKVLQAGTITRVNYQHSAWRKAFYWANIYFFKAAPTQFKVGTFPGPAAPLQDRDYRLQSKVFYDRSHLLGCQALKQQRKRQRSHHLGCKELKPHRQRQKKSSLQSAQTT